MKKSIFLFLFIFICFWISARNGGLQNCGSSCYFNSGIQVLSQTDSLNKILDQKIFTPNSISHLYVKLKNFIKDYPENMPFKSDKKNKNEFLPSDYEISNKILLRDFYHKIATKFFPDEAITEQDSSEFVALLIHEFNLSENEIKDLFSPKVTRILTCECAKPVKEVVSLQDFRCGDERDEVARKMTKIFIRVYLATKDDTTLSDCLTHTFREKQAKKKVCPSCNKKYTIKKFIGSTPKNLILWLDRAPKDKKISNKIQFEDVLDVKDYLLPEIARNEKYKLRGIICHSGDTGGGHYWAYVKDKDEIWYKYNDSSVAEQSYNSDWKSPYVLFYEREDSFQENLFALKENIRQLKEKLQVLQRKLIELKNKLIT